jgi:16S rRNA (guanine966-N2)-methyltransferase
LRIISGYLKGRKLVAVPGLTTRPTADRVREALFNILGSAPRGAAVLDLFAGTGALGIEALSRGARMAVFVDKDARALTALHKNIERCGLHSCAHVVRRDILKSLACLKGYSRVFSLVFLDPPYGRNMLPTTVERLIALEVLADEATLVAEHAGDELPEPAGLTCFDRRRYGYTQLSFFSYHV